MLDVDRIDSVKAKTVSIREEALNCLNCFFLTELDVALDSHSRTLHNITAKRSSSNEFVTCFKM